MRNDDDDWLALIMHFHHKSKRLDHRCDSELSDGRDETEGLQVDQNIGILAQARP